MRKISKATLGVLDTIDSFASLLGVMVYDRFFKQIEVRKLQLYSCYMSLVCSSLYIGYILKWNQAMGVSDEVFLALNSIIFTPLGMAFCVIPMAVLYVRLTPQLIEGTCYALFVGTDNFSNTTISPLVGSFVNKHWIGVTNKNIVEPGYNGFL